MLLVFRLGQLPLNQKHIWNSKFGLFRKRAGVGSKRKKEKKKEKRKRKVRMELTKTSVDLARLLRPWVGGGSEKMISSPSADETGWLSSFLHL